MSNKESHIDIQTIVTLGILFVFYVIGDTTTTLWLISNHPRDIAAESNPLGIYLYTQHGFYGIMTAKLLVFIAISLMAVLIESNYKHETKVMLVSSYSILALMALSLIVLTVNVMMIYALSFQNGSYESTFLFRIYVVMLAMTLGGLILLPKFVPNTLGTVEIVLIFVVLLGPLAFSPGIYQFLLTNNMVNFSAYIGTNVGIIAMMIYGMNRLYKQIIPKKTKTIT